MKRITVTICREASDSVNRAAETLLRGLIRAYKAILSPSFAGSCRFLPSCADYADEAIARHGALLGGWLTFRRFTRCHPLCCGGHDPVPARTAAENGAAGHA